MSDSEQLIFQNMYFTEGKSVLMHVVISQSLAQATPWNQLHQTQIIPIVMCVWDCGGGSKCFSLRNASKWFFFIF
jgi:hypothetical protein